MAAKKNQHYVPKFYLKQFANDGDGKTIGLYHHLNDIFIEKAPLRHQAKETYLYGDDLEIENVLGELEGVTAGLFRIMIKELIPPPEDSNAFNHLKRYILYQSFRTPKAGKHAMDSINKALQAVIPIMYPDKTDALKQGTLVHPNPVELALVNALDKLPLLDYLSIKLIVNLTDLPFITSDDPVVKYNQWLERENAYMGATGLPVKGLQIFLPIHARMTICLYDPIVYTCGEQDKLLVVTESLEEVNQFNVLQYLNSHEQLFFNQFASKEYVQMLRTEYGRLKKTSDPINIVIPTTDGKKMLLSSSIDSTMGLDISFFSIKIPRAEKRTMEVPPFRHPSFYDLYNNRSLKGETGK